MPLLVSANRAGGFTFPQSKFPFTQTCLLRIPPNVAHAIREVLLVTDEPIEIISLPERSRSLQELIGLACRETFPTANHLFQWPFWILHEERVHVIRHYHKRNHRDPRAFKMIQRLCDDLRTLTAPQQTRAISFIKPVFDG